MSRSRTARISARRYRPRLDLLEGRACWPRWSSPAPADSGAGTLREAVDLAASGDTITFDSSLDGQTITLTSGEVVDPGKSLTIQGPGRPGSRSAAEATRLCWSSTRPTGDVRRGDLGADGGRRLLPVFRRRDARRRGEPDRVRRHLPRQRQRGARAAGSMSRPSTGRHRAGQHGDDHQHAVPEQHGVLRRGCQSYGVTVDIRAAPISGNTGIVRPGA